MKAMNISSSFNPQTEKISHFGEGILETTFVELHFVELFNNP